jgi:hypothetical protein
MKTYGGVDVQIQIFLTMALVRDEWSASRPGRFTSGVRAPGTHWIGGWVGLRPSLDVEKRKFWPYWASNSSVFQPFSSYTDCAFQVLITTARVTTENEVTAKSRKYMLWPWRHWSVYTVYIQQICPLYWITHRLFILQRQHPIIIYKGALSVSTHYLEKERNNASQHNIGIANVKREM